MSSCTNTLIQLKRCVFDLEVFCADDILSSHEFDETTFLGIFNCLSKFTEEYVARSSDITKLSHNLYRRLYILTSIFKAGLESFDYGHAASSTVATKRSRFKKNRCLMIKIADKVIHEFHKSPKPKMKRTHWMFTSKMTTKVASANHCKLFKEVMRAIIFSWKQEIELVISELNIQVTLRLSALELLISDMKRDAEEINACKNTLPSIKSMMVGNTHNTNHHHPGVGGMSTTPPPLNHHNNNQQPPQFRFVMNPEIFDKVFDDLDQEFEAKQQQQGNFRHQGQGYY
jgi:hypothetical protein